MRFEKKTIMSQHLLRSDSLYSDLSKEVEMLWDQRLQEVYDEFTHANIHHHSASFPALAPEISSSDGQLVEERRMELEPASFIDPALYESISFDQEEEVNAHYKATWDLREPGTREPETRPKDDIYGARLDLTKSGTSSTVDDTNSDYQSCASASSTQFLPDLDPDSIFPDKEKFPKIETERKLSGNRAVGQNANTDVLFVSACVDLLFIGVS